MSTIETERVEYGERIVCACGRWQIKPHDTKKTLKLRQQRRPRLEATTFGR